MIAALLIWSFLLFVAYIYGASILNRLARFLPMAASATVELPLSLLTGIMVIAVAAMVVHVFIPLGAVFVIGLLLGALWLAFRNQALFPIPLPAYNRLVWVFIGLAFLTILENATHFAANPDTGIYHAQTIRWFETYRIVPGLGNIQERFAFNSSWLVLNAALSLAFLGVQSFRLVNGLMFLTAVLFFSGGVQDLLQKKMTAASLTKILFIVLSFYLLGSEISSVGNDMPITLITWVVIVLWIERIESQAEDQLKAFLIFLLPVFAVTVKLSSLPLLFFTLYILVEHFLKKDWRQIKLLFGLSSILLLPWLVRSVILSGYLVFPISQLDLFNFDWKIPAVQAQAMRHGILGFARYGDDWQAAIGVPLTHWVPAWFEDITLNRKAILLLALVSPVLILAGHFLRLRLISKKYVFAWLVMYTGSFFWFFLAPSIRFGYGFLIGTCLLATLPMLMPAFFSVEQRLKFNSSVMLFILFVFQVTTLWFSVETDGYPRRFLLPADYRPSAAHACEIQGAVIYCRDNVGQCQYELFPCIPYPRSAAQVRGATFQEGFRLPIEP